MNIYSTLEVATQLGVNERTIQRHCKSQGIGERKGRDVILTGDDIERLKPLIKHKASRKPRFDESTIVETLLNRLTKVASELDGFERLDNPNWPKKQSTHRWEHAVPVELAEVWNELSPESRIIAFIAAHST